MKTIHVLCTVRLTNDEYSELLNSNSPTSLTSLVRYILEDGEPDKVVFSDPLVPIPLPPKSE